MLLDPSLTAYLDGLTRSEDPVQSEMEALARELRFPIVGPHVGHLLQVLALCSGARRVLELGSGFGYSALWFARGVGPDGRVVLTDFSQDRLSRAQDFLSRAGLGDRIETRPGDALELAAAMDGPFDIVFNDVDKKRYPDVLPLAERLLRPNGLLVSDNMLWSGRVFEPPAPDDDATRGVLALTQSLTRSPAFRTALVPLRDGVTVSVRL